MTKTLIAWLTIASLLFGMGAGIITSAMTYERERTSTQAKIDQLERDRDMLQRRVEAIDLAIVKERLDVLEAVMVSEHPAYSPMIFYKR